MFAKIGFLLVLALFGALLFGVGVLAPASWRQSAADIVQQAEKQAGALFGKAAPALVTTHANGTSGAESTTAAASASVAAASAPAAGKPDPIPAGSLQLPVPLPEKGLYAVQLGQFTDPARADDVAARARASSLPVDKVLEVVDQGGMRWFVVPVGPFVTLDEARSARAGVAQAMQLGDDLPLILLPAEKPKS